MNRAYVLIGSNVHKKVNYPKALRRLRAIGDVLAISSVYETAPVGKPDAESFYNGVVLLETELDARALKRALRIIETQLGRVRTADPYAPRTIDLDLVLFNHDIINEGDVHVPDPLILRRPFLALALAEISPQYVHPADRRTLKEIANGFGELPVGVRRVPAATANAQQIFNQIYRGELVHA
jgi:2-amino-4-hydroxy-6-hydroxymethyldihydropteridine diphosphokinase